MLELQRHPADINTLTLNLPKTILWQQLVKLRAKHANQNSPINIPNTYVMCE